ncbi:hypothetical protein [Kordia zhangzhouensis]|uniref:hypothetical protein n=1 Tax=Kordia zhangzhouensis TaxID=1620405 RepID=UPI0006297AAE|nr:hypothetical protein [Kordia zhangzhouensis]
MKRSLNLLKSYFETGDIPTQSQYNDVFDSLLHKDEFIKPYTVFIDAQKGNDASAILGSSVYSYQTIDAAIAAYNTEYPRPENSTDLEHSFLQVILIAPGTYEINTQLPQRNILFESKEICTIDFSNNTNEFLNVQDTNVHYIYKFSLPKGTLYNNTSNKIQGSNLFFEGEFDTIESYGEAYSLFGKGFIAAYQINVCYKLVKGNGIIFSSLNSNSINTFKGNIEGVNAKLVLNNEGSGVNYFDFDLITGSHEVALLKSALGNFAHIHFGKHIPSVSGTIASIASAGKMIVNFKDNAEVYGTFGAGEVHLTGNEVTVNAPLLRIQNKLFINNLSIKSTSHLCSLIHANARFYIKNCHIELPQNLAFIETNTNFSGDCIIFSGHNSILQTGTPGSDLVTKFSTALPTNVSYKVEFQNSLVTNGVLNTTIVGNTNTTAIIHIGTSNTY